MFSYVFHGIFGDIVAPRPSKRKEIWAFLKAGLFDKALTALRSPQHGFDPNEKEESSGMVALQYAAAAGKLVRVSFTFTRFFPHHIIALLGFSRRIISSRS